MSSIQRQTYLLLAVTCCILFLAIVVLMPSRQNESPERVTLVTSRWSGPHADYQKNLLERYTKETGIQVIQDDIAYGQLRTKQTMNMANKTAGYDLVWVLEKWMKDYVKAGYILPLNSYFEKTPGFNIKNYMPGLIKLNTFNAKVYGIPTMLQTAIVAYDTQKLQKAGFEPPNTWDEILAVARHFKAQGTGIAMPVRKGMFDDNIWDALMYSNDGSYFDAEGQLRLDCAENIEALQFYQKLMQCAIKGSLNWHVDEANRQLQFGHAPIGITISGLAGILEDPARSTIAGHVGYLPMPYKKHPAGTVSTWNWCIPADSKHPEEAFKLIAWLTSRSIEKEQSLANGQLSAVSSLFNDDELRRKLPFLSAVMPYLDNPQMPLAHLHQKMLMDGILEILFRVSVSNANPSEELKLLQQKMLPYFSTKVVGPGT